MKKSPSNGEIAVWQPNNNYLYIQGATMWKIQFSRGGRPAYLFFAPETRASIFRVILKSGK